MYLKDSLIQVSLQQIFFFISETEYMDCSKLPDERPYSHGTTAWLSRSS